MVHSIDQLAQNLDDLRHPVQKLTKRGLSNHIARQPGALKGKMRIAEDFDAPLPADVLRAFESNLKKLPGIG